MYLCPECQLPLKHRQQEGRYYWVCVNCMGHMIGFGALAGITGRDAAQAFWRRSESMPRDGRPCPSCTQAMNVVLHHEGAAPVELDVCRPCYLLWLDHGEGEQAASLANRRAVAHRTPSQEKQYKDAVLEMARLQTEERMREHDSALLSKDGPDVFWKWIPALMGLPVEYDGHAVRERPYLTMIFAFLIIAFFWVSLQAGLEESVLAFGFVPSEAFRFGGVTFFSSFFLHGGLLHLIGNLYFFLVFADNVEDDLPPFTFIFLIFFSHIAGLFSHSFFSGELSDLPLVGASGGVFGILAYYMVRFPRTRIGLAYFFGFVWLRISAKWLLLGKIAWEFFMSSYFRAGLAGDNVAHLAHAGGAVAGILVALMAQKSRPERVPPEKLV